MADIDELKKSAMGEINAAKDTAELGVLRAKFLGREKGEVTKFLRSLAGMSIEEKRTIGPKIQKIKVNIEHALVAHGKALKTEAAHETEGELSWMIPKIGHLHPITETVRMMNEHFRSMGYSVMDGPEIETDEYCFKRLNVPEDHPARDMQDTIYIEEPKFLLRTQTSSIEARVLEKYRPPFRIVCPGLSYRNEKANKSNHFIFNQYQLVVVEEKVSLKDLFGTITSLFRKLYGQDVVVRFRNKYYPEVEPGVGPDMQCFNCHGKGCGVCKGTGWIEMGGSGIIHPNVLSMAGIDPKKWMGFAFGLGLDRWVMARYNITDIRTLLGGNLAYQYYVNEGTL
jgi:phenylalanyl-tRNA synthetase alpha chain